MENNNLNEYSAEMLTSETSASTYLDNQMYLPVAGGGILNLHNGQLRYSFDALDVGGNLFSKMIKNCFLGHSWATFANQELHFWSESSGLPYYRNEWQDSIFFSEVSELVFEDDCGLDLKVDCNDGVKMIEPDGNIKEYNMDCQLIKYSDANGNYINISHSDKEIRFEDSLGRITIFDKKAKQITDYCGRTITYEYEGSFITRVVWPDGSDMRFTYNGENYKYLNTIKNRDNTINVFKYASDNKVIRVETFPENSDIETDSPEDYVDIEYVNTRMTIVKDRSNIRKIYYFDLSGRPELIYEDIPLVKDGQEIEGRYQVIGCASHQYTNKKRTFLTSVSQTNEAINMVEDGSFEAYAEGDSTWSTADLSESDAVVTTDSISGGKSFKIHNDNKYKKKLIYQTISADKISYKYGNTIVLSGWMKSDGMSRDVLLYAELNYTDGETKSYSIKFAHRTKNFWGYTALPIVVPKGKVLESIKVGVGVISSISQNTNGYCFVDNIRLTNSPVKFTERITNCNYNAVIFGKSVSIKEKSVCSDGIYTTTDEYNEEKDLVKRSIVDGDENEFVSYMEYDSHHNCILLQNERGIITKTTYNDRGQPTAVKTWYSEGKNPSTITEPSEYFLKTMTYDETGEFLICDGDARNDSIYTENEYNKTRCALTASTSPNGQRTTYAYDPTTDLLTGISAVEGDKNYAVEYGYTNRRLGSITHNGFDYGFTYDGMGRTKDVKIAGVTHSSNDYQLSDTTTVTTTYATGEKMRVETDRNQKPIKRTYIDELGSETVVSTAEYDALGKIVKIIDNSGEIEYNYKYDGFDNVTEEAFGATNICNIFDSNNRLTEVQIASEDLKLNIAPIYERDSEEKIYPDNAVVGVDYNNGDIVSKITKDEFDRTVGREIRIGDGSSGTITESYGYYASSEADGMRLTPLLNRITQNFGYGGNHTLSYSYDNNGNITHVYKDGELILRYHYDGMNQLVREDNSELAITYVYEYDTAGNILSQKVYPYTTVELGELISTKTYTYETSGWKDLLTAVDDRTITYDELGNPTNYLGYDVTWDKVRQLKTFGYHTFYYGADGKRCGKNETRYIYQGDKLLREVHQNGDVLTFLYDTTGILGFSFRTNLRSDENGELCYDEKRYFYKKNLQGDVIAVYDELGTKCAEYIYDAWGNCTVTYDRYGISELNPIRYRGYYYDTETDLYYLGSRYYDPEIGRFINADVVFDNGAGILGYNLYAYCANNPVVNLDIAGFFLFAAIGAAVGAIGGAIVATLEGKSAKEIKAAAVSGAISGGISGGVMDILTVTGGSAILVASVCALGGFVGSLAGAMVENKMNGKNPWTWEVISTALIDAAWGAVFGAISGAMEDSITPMMKKVAASTGKKLQKKGITIGTAIWRTLRKEWINLWDTIISEGLTNFSYWYFEEKVDKMLEDY